LLSGRRANGRSDGHQTGDPTWRTRLDDARGCPRCFLQPTIVFRRAPSSSPPNAPFVRTPRPPSFPPHVPSFRTPRSPLGPALVRHGIRLLALACLPLPCSSSKRRAVRTQQRWLCSRLACTNSVQGGGLGVVDCTQFRLPSIPLTDISRVLDTETSTQYIS
jgi:hypothetical protein